MWYSFDLSFLIRGDLDTDRFMVVTSSEDEMAAKAKRLKPEGTLEYTVGSS